MEFITIFLVLSSLVCAWLFNFRFRKSVKLPPGPYAFPIIGNILQLGQYPHQSLEKLSKTYGPLMSLHLGSIYAVVVSSPELAKEILQKHDLAFSGRPILIAGQAYNHNKNSIILLPADSQWKKLRKICREQMFSTQSLVTSEGLRKEKLRKMFDYVQECCVKGRVVNIGEVAFTTTLNLMSATLFSVDVTNFDSDSTQEWKETIEGLLDIVGAPNFADFLPFLKMFDPQGIKREADFYFGKLLPMFGDIINQRLESRRTLPHDSPKKKDLLEVLLDLGEGSEYGLSCNEIKHFLLDLFVGGSSTTAITAEWVMTELLHNPQKMSIAKDELKNVIGNSNKIEESDISKLPYLQAVVKETLRYQPTAPLLVPHRAEHDVEIKGYTIPKNTQILVNVWAMGRDPNLWSNPNSFEPERFLGSKVDVGGQDFELIPFGSGRRICPGLPLANRMLHIIVASLIHNFNWELESGGNTGKVVKFGTAHNKAATLKALPTKL